MMAVTRQPNPLTWFRDDDANFGQQVIPVLANILDDLCACNDKRACEFVSKFHAATIPPITIRNYMERICTYSECSNTVFVLALIYIDRIQKHPRFVVNSYNIHRLLITSCLLAAKFFDDHFFANKFWSRIGGISLQELNGLELEFLFLIGFALDVPTEEFIQYETELYKHVTLRQQQAALWLNAPDYVSRFAPRFVPSMQHHQQQQQQLVTFPQPADNLVHTQATVSYSSSSDMVIDNYVQQHEPENDFGTDNGKYYHQHNSSNCSTDRRGSGSMSDAIDMLIEHYAPNRGTPSCSPEAYTPVENYFKSSQWIVTT